MDGGLNFHASTQVRRLLTSGPMAPGRDAILDQHLAMRRQQFMGYRAVMAGASRQCTASQDEPEASPLEFDESPNLKWGTLAVLGRDNGSWQWALFTSRVHAESAEKLAKESASKLYKQGQAAEAAGDIEAAYELYHSAFQKNPKDLRYQDEL